MTNADIKGKRQLIWKGSFALVRALACNKHSVA